MSSNIDSSEIHRRVADQYRKFPYPAAEDDLSDFINRRAVQAGCPSQFFHLYWPYRKKDIRLDILIAGCGTAQAAKFALNLPGARISAIDLCEHSIEHTNRLLKKHHIENVSTFRLPVEEVATLGKSFDLIISTGVLHHLPDPIEGLKALDSVLRADGSMYLMLYGKYGRDGIYYMQELLRRIGLNASSVSADELLSIRQLIRNLPAHHALSAKKHFFCNFDVGDEELVDLFLHPQDRGYSFPDILDLLDRGGLKMQSVLLRAHYAPSCCRIAGSSFMQQIATLDELEQLCIGELYRAAVLMHFFIACKKNRDEKTYRINLNGSNWKSLIPVAGPAVLQDTQDVPEGYNTVLYSPMHQFDDIRCPLTACERALFSLTNNQNSIGKMQNIVKSRYTEVSDDELVRQFFRKMYDYDFVSFRGA